MTPGRLFIVAVLTLSACSGRQPVLDGPAGIRLIRIPAGEFMMGSPEAEAGRETQEALHRVRLSKPFYLGVTEVTQKQWRTVMGNNPSHFVSCGDDCPVERVNVSDVESFVAKLNAQSDGGFRLPTEAEWEYACRAGGRAPFGSRKTLGGADANINGRYPYGAASTSESAGTQPAGRFPPNAWGLFDMHGNVWEWTEDAHCPYPAGAVTDPVGRCESPHRVIRGGSWKFDANSARCGLRYTHRPQDLGFSLGFRVARDAR